MTTGMSTMRTARGAARRLSAMLLGVAMSLATASCTFLKAAPDTSRYFVLSSTETSNVQSRNRPDIHFGVGPVKLPGYLDTQNLVRTGASGTVEYVPNAFWAESVKEAFQRALLYRTSARIGTSHTVAYPWYSTTRVDFRVPVDVLHFEATTDGRAVLHARWSVESVPDGRIIASEQSVLEETAGTDPATIVDALNRCIDRLADAIAAAVASTPPRNPGQARVSPKS